MFIDIYARSFYSATLHNDLPLRPLPPYQGLRIAQDTPRPRALWRPFRALRNMVLHQPANS